MDRRKFLKGMTAAGAGTAVHTLFHYDEAEDRGIIETIQDVEPIMDLNKQQSNSADSNWNQTMNHVARIPKSVIEQYRIEKGIDLMNDEAELKKFLNDPDQRVWRTRGGNV